MKVSFFKSQRLWIRFYSARVFAARSRMFQYGAWALIIPAILACNFCVGQGEKIPLQSKISINTGQGHSIVQGASGFNVRIGDKVWSYNHPDFIHAVHELKPGWLRYWSGTAGDAFCAGTGQYDKEYINLFDKGEAYDKLYKFMEVKGPARIIDLYRLMGSIGGKIVVTINAFTETPEMTAELARFCRNNDIVVECWQFCNEPYFYVPGRQRYWWNDGYDYAQKMKPHADSILSVFPDAKMALNFTWDGTWSFMKEINRYQKERGAFWNVFSKHSYAPHTGKDESFEEASRRMNTKLLEVTGDNAMNEIEQWTSKGIPMLITEFGVWNKSLNGISSAIYNAEYTLRQLSHPNTWLIASHEISNKIRPAKNFNNEILKAYDSGSTLNTNGLRTGIEWDDEGKALRLVHEATGNSNFVYATSVSGGAQVNGMNNTRLEGVYAEAFRGAGDEDYLLITNRSEAWHSTALEIDGTRRPMNYSRSWINGKKGNEEDVTVQREEIKDRSTVIVPPFSVVLLQWKNDRRQVPPPSRIYEGSVKSNGIMLKWWPVAAASAYELQVKDVTTGEAFRKRINGSNDSLLFSEMIKGHVYDFSIFARNAIGLSQASPAVSISFSLPKQPSIFRVAARDDEATVFWHSVPDAEGYTVIASASDGNFRKEFDAGNVFGYKIRGLHYGKAYVISVRAYNGLGKGISSQAVTFTAKKGIPLPPSNISAIENSDGTVSLKWNAPKDTIEGIRYRLYRGEKPHQFAVLKEGLDETSFVDRTTGGKEYFYTVKAYTRAGECNSYPNIATIIRNNKTASVKVESISKVGDSYEVKVSYCNVPIDGEVVFGILLSDVSYLNGEEVFYRALSGNDGTYTVDIPESSLKEGSTYAVKASIQTNGGTPVMSLPPLKEFKVE